MVGKVLQLEDVIDPDGIAQDIANNWMRWKNMRANWERDKEEVRKYVYATDTSQTSNSSLPWKNKTTLPKLCQIRDNLYANYMRSLFPKRKWVYWEAYDFKSSIPEKKKAIEVYMANSVDRSNFKNTCGKLIQDWIDYGNCFAMPVWKDERVETDTHDQVGYVGPAIERISPLDIVFNPISPSFTESPKIIRSVVPFGEVKMLLEQWSTEENREELEKLWAYIKDYRERVAEFPGDVVDKDAMFDMDGFDSYKGYIQSGFAEILTFYGDAYDAENDKFYKNHVIKVIDRHKILDIRPNDSMFGLPPIYHVGWRIRQDNLWAMGPLDNLVGMQYRIDHLENLKADVFDLIAFPPLHIKGYVEDFDWGPFTRIHSDVDGEVKVLSPDVNALSANIEINVLEQKMEEMAGAPKEAMGFRTPGEKTMYEVQRLENAAGRIFQSKIEFFEELMIEPLMSAMLEMARRKLTSQEVFTVDDELGYTEFMTLTAKDITGNGRIRPVAARHFAEKAEKTQNLTEFFNSAVGQDPAVNVHFSGFALAKMFEDVLDLEGYGLVQENVRISEQADTQRLMNSQEEQVGMETQTPSGLSPDDFNPEVVG